MTKKVVGIILIVLFALSVCGGIAGGDYARYASEGIKLYEIFSLVFQAAMLVIGVILVVIGKKPKQ